MPKVFILQNYNRFLINPANYCTYRWDDFFIHRFKADFNRLVKFETRQDAEQFLTDHPDVGGDWRHEPFGAWIIETDPSDWK